MANSSLPLIVAEVGRITRELDQIEMVFRSIHLMVRKMNRGTDTRQHAGNLAERGAALTEELTAQLCKFLVEYAKQTSGEPEEAQPEAPAMVRKPKAIDSSKPQKATNAMPVCRGSMVSMLLGCDTSAPH